jgi:O-antigen ligase
VAAAVLVPAAVLLLAGRGNEAWTSRGGTSQSRIQLWSEGLELFREAPLFGIGIGEYNERAEQVAHNSFIHCYAELGLFGGTVFLGAFYLAIWSTYRLGRHGAPGVDPELRRLQPFVPALVAAYAAGVLSLSRSYIVPTYMYLGLAAVYIGLAGEAPPECFDGRLARRLVLVSLVFLPVAYLFVRIFVERGA